MTNFFSYILVSLLTINATHILYSGLCVTFCYYCPEWTFRVLPLLDNKSNNTDGDTRVLQRFPCRHHLQRHLSFLTLVALPRSTTVPFQGPHSIIKSDFFLWTFQRYIRVLHNVVSAYLFRYILSALCFPSLYIEFYFNLVSIVCQSVFGYKPRLQPARDGEIWSGYLATDPAFFKNKVEYAVTAINYRATSFVNQNLPKYVLKLKKCEEPTSSIPGTRVLRNVTWLRG